MEGERAIRSSGNYNLKFIDWDNECFSVIDHLSSLSGNKQSASGMQYESSPYFDVPLSEVEFLFRNLYDCTSTGLTEREIENLERISNDLKDCTICLASSTFGIRLPCGHVFHDSCIARWLRCRVDCPNCRTSARTKT